MNQKEYFDLLDRTTAETLAVARSHSAKELHTALPGKWTPLQVLEHSYLTESLVIGLLHRPSAEQHDQEEVHGSGKLYHLIVNKRAHKITAPDRLHPKNIFKDVEDFAAAFTGQRQELHDAIEGGTVTIDNRLFPHPVLGNMTISDWLYFLVHHTQRHVEQLKEQQVASGIVNRES